MANDLYQKTRIKMFLQKEKELTNEYFKIDLNSDGFISENGMIFHIIAILLVNSITNKFRHV